MLKNSTLSFLGLAVVGFAGLTFVETVLPGTDETVRPLRLGGFEDTDPIHTGSVRMVQAQTATETPPPRRPPTDEIDESALRYFAAQGDTQRMDAEIARLKRLHPDWTPPQSVDEILSRTDPQAQYLWDLFADGNYAGVREAIADRRETEPGWEPSDALINALDLAEARLRMANAATLEQWNTVLSIARNYPNLLVCAEMSALWNVGEAFARTDQRQDALELYTYILKNCNDPGERLATVQKASAVLPAEDVETLLAFERPSPDGLGEFASVRDDPLRARIGEAAQETDGRVSPVDLDRLGDLARETSDPADATLLGFYYYAHGTADEAEAWFKDALDWGGGAKAAEGYVLALTRAGKQEEAARIAATWRDETPDNAKAYVDVMTTLLTDDPPRQLNAELVQDFARFTSATRSATGAQALGFYALNTDQTDTAGKWFKAALEWEPELEQAALGLAIYYQRKKDTKALAALVSEWAPKSQAIASLSSSGSRGAARSSGRGMTSGGAGAGTGGGASVGPTACVHRSPPPSSLSPASALAFGWCLMDLDRPIEAVSYFERAIAYGDERTAGDAAYGKSLAYLRKGMTGDAAVASTQAPQRPDRAAELHVSIITQSALEAYARGQYARTLALLDQRNLVAPEEVDLMVIRAWSLYQLQRFEDARRMFQAIQRTGRNREAAEGLNAIDERLERIIPGG